MSHSLRRTSRSLVSMMSMNNNRFLYIKSLLLLLILLMCLFILSDKLLSNQLPLTDTTMKISKAHNDSDVYFVNNDNIIFDNNDDIRDAKLYAKSKANTQLLSTLDDSVNYSPIVITSVNNETTIRFGIYEKSTIKIAITVCGEQSLEQSLITLKSAVILTNSKLHFVIMADDLNIHAISQSIVTEWPNHILKRISFEVHSVSFPATTNVEEWRKLFKLCAAQRLFLPTLLKHIDAILYVDTDVIFLTPVDEIWNMFAKMNSSQMAGMSPESEDFASSWYYRFAKHPYVHPLGVNSGVMLMNLTRMRAFDWQSYLQPMLSKYKLNIVWGDQDIINIIFHFHTDKLYIFSCNYNYRPDHCIYTSVCKKAEKDGVFILHGNRGVFLNNKQPTFRAVFQSFQDFGFTSDLKSLVTTLKNLFTQFYETNCDKASQSILTALLRFVNNVK